MTSRNPVIPGWPVTLTVETGPDRHTPDSVSLGFEEDDGATQMLGRLDGRSLSTEVAGGFLGHMVGINAVGGVAAFDCFDDSGT
jgi:xylan 1,4-beta-xylosidase